MNARVADHCNPYDFANPVSEAKLFAGRRSELQDITYYVELAAKTDRPINLALLGERASGKTSLLNMTEQLASKLAMIPVRIDLDESDVVHQFALFVKIFTALLTRACERANAFGGLEGRTFQTYLEMVSTLEVPNERSFCSFLFPIQYAKASASGRIADTLVFDDFLRHDLLAIKAEVSRTFILIFDECNVLSGSRALLEKLRNIFMNIPGFMLVFAGTPELFPVLDEVFSPISRQFKRIEVKGFRKVEETRECIRKPLESIGIDSPEDVFDFGSDGSVREVHRLTGGRPYEIQLVCHAMFRRLQEGRSERMALDGGVLEDVRRDLVRAQSPDRKALIRKIQELSDNDLLALGMLCGVGSSLKLDQVVALEYMFHGAERLTRDDLHASAQNLIKGELVGLDDEGRVRFLGDDFDFTYFRYLASERKVNFLLRATMPIAYAMSLEFALFLMEFEGVYSFLRDELAERNGEVEEIVALVRRVGDVGDNSDLFREYESDMDEVHDILFRRPDVDEVQMWTIEVSTEWWTGPLFCYVYKDDVFESQAEGLRSRLGELQRRGDKVGASVAIDEFGLRLPDRELVLEKLKNSENSKFRTDAARKHMVWLRFAYLTGRKARAEQHANIVSALDVELDAAECNNIGYLRLSQGRREDATKMFDAGIAKTDKHGSEFGLLSYNRGVARALDGDRTGALEDFEAAAKWAEGRTKGSTTASCLFALRNEGGQLAVEEITSKPDVGELASEGMRLLG